MSNCEKCNKRTSRDDAGIIMCAGKNCGHIYHLICVKLKLSDVEFMKREKKLWSCDNCVLKRRNDQYSGIVPASPRQNNGNISISSPKNITLDTFYNDFVVFKKSLLTEMKVLSTRFDTFENIIMPKIVKLESENSKLKSELSLIREKANFLEQSQLHNCVEFHGVPEISKDKVYDTALKLINNGLGFEYNSSIFDYCYTRKLNFTKYNASDHSDNNNVKININNSVTSCVDTENDNFTVKSNNVLFVKFMSRDTKDKVLHAYRSNKVELTSHLIVTDSKTRIFLNECLSQYNRSLFVAAKVVKKDLKYRYVWYRNGVIMMRKNDGDATRKIKSLEDLEIIKNKTLAQPGAVI